jgi:phosphoribosylamine--glycine ligase
MASGGYPGNFVSGKKISGLERVAKIEGVKVFHAGTTKREGAIYTSGGRVLGVSAHASTLEAALGKAYEAAGLISFEDMHFRKDIGARALKAHK